MAERKRKKDSIKAVREAARQKRIEELEAKKAAREKKNDPDGE